jgi:hypothetical protein
VGAQHELGEKLPPAARVLEQLQLDDLPLLEGELGVALRGLQGLVAGGHDRDLGRPGAERAEQDLEDLVLDRPAAKEAGNRALGYADGGADLLVAQILPEREHRTDKRTGRRGQVIESVSMTKLS